MIETFVMYVSAQTSVNVFRIAAIATTIGISTAGSVPKTKKQDHERAEAADQRLGEHARAACRRPSDASSSGSRPVTLHGHAGRQAALAARARVCSMRRSSS